MKRIVAMFVLFVFFLSMVPAVQAYEAPVTSSNKDEHYYVNAGRFNDPITSTLEVTEDGYNRVEYVGDRLIAEKYDRNFQFISGQEIQLELPIYGGVYLGEDYNFVVVGQMNPDEDDAVEVFRIVRYSKDWVRQASASLYGANTYIPFDAGSLRFARSGDILYIRTAHEMYASSDGLHHQANVMISVRISDMTVTDQLTKVWNRNYGYVSHSFNQFVLVDGNDLLAVDHGDALPRSVVLFKYSAPAGQETFYSRTSYVNALPIVDSTFHYNDTGVSVGGFEASSDHYLIAGSSADQTEPCDLMYAHRNIFVTATPKDNFTDDATTVRWLTNFAEEDYVEVSPPHMVKLSADRFFLIWTENGQIRYCTLNGKGELEGDIQSAEGDLSDCVPVVNGGKVVWYVTNYSAPKFYVIDPDASAHSHSYASVVTEPTCEDQGYTTYTCSCGDSYVDDYTGPLGHSYEDGRCVRCGGEDPDYNAGIASGWSGTTQWTLTADGTLTVYGEGKMKDYGYNGGQPWLAYADQIKSVVIEEGVTAVGSGAFMNLTKLESVTLPRNGLSRIGEAAFYGCTSLKEIDIPDTVYTVFDYTFKNCASLEKVRLSRILVKVGQGAFENCTALDYIYIPGETEIIGAWSFKGCTDLAEVDMTWANATEIREGAFKNCASLTTVLFPGGIKKLGDSAFYGIGATSFTVPATVTEVGPWCFARAYSMRSITFKGNAPKIGEGAFNKVTLTAYYPRGNGSWTTAVMQNYGGTVTWKAN